MNPGRRTHSDESRTVHQKAEEASGHQLGGTSFQWPLRHGLSRTLQRSQPRPGRGCQEPIRPRAGRGDIHTRRVKCFCHSTTIQGQGLCHRRRSKVLLQRPANSLLASKVSCYGSNIAEGTKLVIRKQSEIPIKIKVGILIPHIGPEVTLACIPARLSHQNRDYTIAKWNLHHAKADKVIIVGQWSNPVVRFSRFTC